MKRKYEIITDRLLTRQMLMLMLAGLGINVALVELVRISGLPIFLDNVGSILVAVLGGPLPGMTVGFLANLVNSISDPITLYYGVLTVLIALVAAEFSQHGWLKHVRGCLALVLCTILIGGAGGSIMTWLLYGGGIGEGVSSPYAHALHQMGMSAFLAQLTADIGIDCIDKLITVAMVSLVLHFYPRKLKGLYPLSYLYDRSQSETDRVHEQLLTHYRNDSLHSRLVRLLAISLLLLSALTTLVGTFYYGTAELQQYRERAVEAAHLLSGSIHGKIGHYMAVGPGNTDYGKAERRLYEIQQNIDNLIYAYVYKIDENGSQVIFDLDTGHVPPDRFGDILPFDEDFTDYYPAMRQGQADIPPVVSNGDYGWLVTAYAPVYDEKGQVMAYAGADISLVDFVRGLLTYLIKLIAVEFGISIVILFLGIWYAQRRVLSPINNLVAQSLSFDRTDAEQWLGSKAWLERFPVDTGDEIETLYYAVCRVEENVAHNVTKLRENERRLIAAAELEHRNRELSVAMEHVAAENAAKTEFYSRMSHDMRTPMNGILGLVRMAEDTEDPRKLKEYMRKIGTAGGYLLGLINDTLDISKLKQKKLTLDVGRVSIQALLDNLQEMLNPSMQEKELEFRLECPKQQEQVYVLADALRVRQIFMNILSNAIKFTPCKGRIDFIIRSMALPDQRIRYVFIVRDNGVGMSRHFRQQQLFQPFSQENNSLTAQYAGSGLGLAITKNLIDLMGGTVSVESRIGEGTQFTIELTFMKAEPEEDEPVAGQEQEKAVKARLNGRSVLLCEDNALNTEVAVYLLEAVGMQVQHAENGQQAVELFARSAKGTFDAILMDIRMPIMDGLTATRRIRSLDHPDAATIPIIAMTANAYKEDREQTSAAGMNAHLAKPIDVRALYQTLAEWIAE